MTDKLNTRGWIAFDQTCPFCRRAVATWGPLFRKRGFQFIPLQTDWVAQRLGLEPGETPNEFKLLLPDGRQMGGCQSVPTVGSGCLVDGPIWRAIGIAGAVSFDRSRVSGGGYSAAMPGRPLLGHARDTGASSSGHQFSREPLKNKKRRD